MKEIKILRLVLTLTLLSLVTYGSGQKSSSGIAGNKHQIWTVIDTFFLPPPKWEHQLSHNRSPLVFYNGDSVRTAADWQKRRSEIHDIWMDLMGNWPPFLKNQKLVIIDSIHREDFMQYKVAFNWLPNERTYGYLLVPHDGGKKPAVITVYYEPETAIGEGELPNRDFAYQLALRGFVTLSLGTKKASESRSYSLYYPDINHVSVEPLSMLGYAASNAWYALSHYPGVDSTRIGIVGHSFGGKWAMFASCLFDKFACAVWSDPGIVFQNDRPSINYWEPWYLGYHPPPWRKRGLITKRNPAHGLYPRLIANDFDLTDLHALMAPRPFLVSGGSEDPPARWTALNHSRQVNGLLGYHNRVAMHNRPDHGPTEGSNEVIFLFFEYWLK